MSNSRPPAVYPNYPAAAWQMVTDKTGTIWQTVNGRLVAGGPWGVFVFRCPPQGKPQQVYFMADGHGELYVDVMTKRLLLLATDKNWQMWVVPMEGYVHPADCPDSTVVSINEAQLASLRQQLSTTQAQASAAQTAASTALVRVDDMAVQVREMRRQIDALQSQVNALLTPSQVADLVWQKIKDINYLYRLAFLAWPKPAPDQDIKAYVDDLVTLIRKAK